MQPEDLRRRYEYLIESRRRFLATFREIGWTKFSEDRGASWGSMLGIFLHMLDVEEGWWQIALQGGALADTPDRKIADFGTFEEVAQENERVGSLTRARLDGLRAEDLPRSVTFQAGEPVTRSVERILEHAAVDQVAHLGEFVCLLWQLDVRPPFVDWLDFPLPA